jgi:hypothetical protein
MSIERTVGEISKGCAKNKPIQIVKLISAKKDEPRPYGWHRRREQNLRTFEIKDI